MGRGHSKLRNHCFLTPSVPGSQKHKLASLRVWAALSFLQHLDVHKGPGAVPTLQLMKGDCSERVWTFKEKCVGH